MARHAAVMPPSPLDDATAAREASEAVERDLGLEMGRAKQRIKDCDGLLQQCNTDVNKYQDPAVIDLRMQATEGITAQRRTLDAALAEVQARRNAAVRAMMEAQETERTLKATARHHWLAWRTARQDAANQSLTPIERALASRALATAAAQLTQVVGEAEALRLTTEPGARPQWG